MAKKQPTSDSLDVSAIINDKFGAGTLITLGSAAASHYNTISTGSLRLDDALGIGGIPRGRIVEIYGAESSGKTTLTLHMIQDAQRQGLKCAFIDAEHALDPDYAKALGVDLGALLISQPDYGEQALDICEAIVSHGSVGLIVIDSVAALTPKAELDGEMGDKHVGLQARMIGQAMRKLAASVHKHDIALVFINQTRMKIGVMYGSPETTPGGNALKFYASIRIKVTRTGSSEVKGVKVSNSTKAKVVKNKCAAPFRECEFDIEFGRGVSKTGELIDMAVERGLLSKSGAWYAYLGANIAQGREGLKQVLETTPQIYNDLINKVRAR